MREARDCIPGFLEEARAGTEPKPKIFGSRRKPEAVLLPYRVYVDLLEEIDDLSIARTVRQRDASRGEHYVELDEAMRALDFDPAEHAAG